MSSNFVGKAETNTQKTISLQLNPELSVEDAQALLVILVSQLTPIIGYPKVQSAVQAAAGVPQAQG